MERANVVLQGQSSRAVVSCAVRVLSLAGRLSGFDSPVVAPGTASAGVVEGEWDVVAWEVERGFG